MDRVAGTVHQRKSAAAVERLSPQLHGNSTDGVFSSRIDGKAKSFGRARCAAEANVDGYRRGVLDDGNRVVTPIAIDIHDERIQARCEQQRNHEEGFGGGCGAYPL